LRVGDHLRVGAGQRGALVAAVETCLDLLHVIGDALGFAEKLLGALDLLPASWSELNGSVARLRASLMRLVACFWIC
jgi:hypothetical protein